MVTNAKIKELINNLGGTNEIFSFISSKGLSIKTASIYKWKNNGIPHRYRFLIHELAKKKNIAIDKNIFSTIENSENYIVEHKILESDKQNSKKSHHFLYYILLITIFIFIITFLYFFYLNQDLEKKISIIDNEISKIKDGQGLKSLKHIITNNSATIKELEIILTNNKKLITDNQNLLDDSYKHIDEKFLSLNKYISSLKVNSIKNGNSHNLTSIIYLLLAKQKLLKGQDWSNNINLVARYINNNLDSPKDVVRASEILLEHSKIKVFNKFELTNQIILLIKENNKIKKEIKYPELFIDKIKFFSKQFIKIGKRENNNILSDNMFMENISKSFNESPSKALSYMLQLENNSIIYKNDNYKKWLNNLKKLVLVEQSIDLIINWIVEEGFKS